MKALFTLILVTTLMLGNEVFGKIAAVWSTDIAVPGEKTALYLVDTEIGEDIFMLEKRPKVQNAGMEILQPQAGSNPQDANRAPVEIYPILITPDTPGVVQLSDVEVKYSKSGRTEKVSVPPLRVLSTENIRWMDSPINFGVLWYTDIKDGYTDQPIHTSLKLFLPGGIDAPMPPQLHAVGVKAGNFRPSLDGVAALAKGSTLGATTARAKMQEWRTVDYKGILTPFRKGNSDVAGKILLTQQRSFFATAQEEAELPILTISALPLPPGAPANFAATVGEYSISATTTAKSLAMHEAVEVEITVKGTGNLEQLECPKPDDAEHWKLVPATRKPLLDAQGNTTGIIFSQLIRPTAEVGGIPSFSFGYFDPKKQEYRQAATAPIALPWRASDVAGSGLTTTVAAEPPPAGSIPVAEMTDIYGYLPAELAGRTLTLPRWLWYLLYLPAASILAWLAARAIRRRIAAGESARAQERELAQLESIADDLTFLRAVGSYIESHIPQEQMNPHLRQILDKRDTETFRPDASTSLSPTERSGIMHKIRKALTGSLSLLLLALLLLPAPLAAQEAAETAYKAGQYTKALELLSAAKAPDAANLYNQGNCHYRLGQPGQAALCYARALQQNPSLPEARANLAFIQRKEGALLPSGSATDAIFTLLTVSQLWVAGIISTALLALFLALAMWRGASPAWMKAGISLSAAATLLCLADWAYYTTRQTPDLSSLPPADIAYVLQSAEMRTAADPQGSPLITLTPSTPLHLLARRGSWCYAETFTGIRGWLPQEAIAPLCANGQAPEIPLILRF